MINDIIAHIVKRDHDKYFNITNGSNDSVCCVPPGSSLSHIESCSFHQRCDSGTAVTTVVTTTNNSDEDERFSFCVPGVC